MHRVDAGPVLVAIDQLEGDGSGLIGSEALLGEGNELAVDASPEHVTGLDVKVRRASLDRGLDDFLHVHQSG